METSLDSCIHWWRGLQALSIGWLLLTSAFIVLTFPSELLFVVAPILLLVVLVGTIAVLRGRRSWTTFSLLVLGSLFIMLLLVQTISERVAENLHVTLLQFTMVLFAVEILNSAAKQYDFFVKTVKSEAVLPASLLHTSIQNSFGQLSRLGLLFGSCYLISLAILYTGSLIASISPMLGDVSLYVVIASISLALLVLFREDQKQIIEDLR